MSDAAAAGQSRPEQENAPGAKSTGPKPPDGTSTSAPLAPWLLLAAACALLLFRSWVRARYFDGQPFDGPFQLLNPLERLREGQIPGRDFPLFHGLALLYLHYPLYALLGHDLFGSELARQLLTPLGWAGAMALLCRALTGSPQVGSYALALFAALACVSGMDVLGVRNPIVSQPGHSLIALRWAYPAACGAVLLWAFAPRSPNLRRAAIAGACFGFGPVWSYEQGSYAMAAAFTVIAALCVMRAPRWRGMGALGCFAAAMLLALFLGFAALSGGAPLAPLKFAFSTIPHDQGWYFGAPPNQSLAVDGFAREARIFVAALTLLAAVFCFALTRARRAIKLILGLGFLLAFSALSGCSLTGMLSPSYLSPVVNALMIAAVVLSNAVLAAHPERRRRLAALTLLGGAGVVALAAWHEAAAFGAAVRAPASMPAEVAGVRPAGLYRSLGPLIEQVRAWRESRAGGDSAGSTTVFSTYRGLLDIAVAQPPVGRADYIIHAFDDAGHAQYLREFERSGFQFAHTMRAGYMGYEEWLQTSHWDFYRLLVEGYAVVAQSDFSLLWQRREVRSRLRRAGCAPLEAAPGSRTAWVVPATPAGDYFEVTVEYTASNALAKIPIVGGLPRFLLEHHGLGNHLPLSLNPDHTRISWLVRGIPGQAGSVVQKVAAPLGGAGLTVHEINACRISMPDDVAPAFAHLAAGGAPAARMSPP